MEGKEGEQKGEKEKGKNKERRRIGRVGEGEE
jgi:hypothetical protein